MLSVNNLRGIVILALDGYNATAGSSRISTFAVCQAHGPITSRPRVCLRRYLHNMLRPHREAMT
jgi:hypothetical protein